MSDPSAAPPGAHLETPTSGPGSSISPGLMLVDLAVGDAATILGVEIEGPIGQRLRDLGFRPGTRVTCRRRAPLGDPRVSELAGSQVCLRRSEAGKVRIRPLADSGSGASAPE